MMDLDVYRKRVKALAAARNHGGIFNGSADHAAIIVESLFAIAEKNVRILTGDLDARVYGNPDVVSTVRQFLGHSDHTLEVLVESRTFNSSHPLIEELVDQDNVSFYEIPRETASKIEYHFMIADDDSFRFEQEKNTHSAIAGFGDKDVTKNLIGIFDRLKGDCVPFSLTPSSV